MVDYDFDSLRPTFNGVAVKRKIEANENYAKLLLFANLKTKQNPPSFTLREVSRFFQLDIAYAHRILEFFVDASMLQKIKRSSKLVFYVPIKSEIQEHVDAAYQKTMGGKA